MTLKPKSITTKLTRLNEVPKGRYYTYKNPTKIFSDNPEEQGSLFYPVDERYYLQIMGNGDIKIHQYESDSYYSEVEEFTGTAVIQCEPA